MTGVEDGKGGGGGDGGTDVSATDNVNQQNGGTEKAPVVTGTNMETLPRPGKQVRQKIHPSMRTLTLYQFFFFSLFWLRDSVKIKKVERMIDPKALFITEKHFYNEM